MSNLQPVLPSRQVEVANHRRRPGSRINRFDPGQGSGRRRAFERASSGFARSIVALWLIFSPLFFPSPGFSAKVEDDQIKQIETDLSREKQQFRRFNLKEKNLLGQLAAIEKSVEKKRKIIEKVNEDLSASRLLLDRVQAHLNDHETTLSKLRQRLEQRLVAYYKYSKRGYMQVLSATEGLDELRRRMKYLHVIMTEDHKMIKMLVDEKAKYDEALLEKKKQLQVIQGMEEEEKKELRSLEGELEKKVIILSRIHREKEFYETAVNELQSAAEDLKETILTIEKRANPGQGRLPKNFSSYKGKLSMPVGGKVIRNKNPLGDRRVYTERGIYISGPLGGEVKAVFDGRVDFSGWIKGYGQVLVINHGSRFYTVLAHLMERNKEEGDFVSKGEVVGLLGQSGSLIGPGLYFELRRAGKTLDPLEWLKDH